MDEESLPQINGEWQVIGTTFPMWKKGDKLHPRFRYTPLEKGLWKDEVLYENKKGRTKTIRGKDRLMGEHPLRFKWRGDGLLVIAVSKWQIDFISEDGNLAFITFEKTIFTPAGADVISRNGFISDIDRTKMCQLLHERFLGKMDDEWMWLL